MQEIVNLQFSLSTGSHLSSIQNVLDGRVEVASIDSNALKGYFLQHPEKQADLKVLLSLGPLPTYPIVFNSRLPGKHSLHFVIQ